MLEVKSKATSKSKAALLDLVFVALFAAVMTVVRKFRFRSEKFRLHFKLSVYLLQRHYSVGKEVHSVL